MYQLLLMISHGSRDVHDVVHKVTAVGSRDVSKAQQFIDKNITGDAKNEAKAYGSYEETVKAVVSGASIPPSLDACCSVLM